jgi:hypothetical protein
MPKLVAAILFGAVVLAASPAVAEIDCSPSCDYNHYYGPSDFTYVRPGLYGWPRCDAAGNCSPYLVYTYPRFSVSVRTRPAAARRPRR